MIEAENIAVWFRKGRFGKKLEALDDFSLVVEPGEVLALLGPNGAGKSTAMYCFLGLIQPDRGRVSVLGQRPIPGSDLFRKIAYLPEEPHYHDYLSVREAVAYYAALHGAGLSERSVDNLIDRVGLTEHRDLRVSKCSKGMKQKVGIAQCLLTCPEIVFLDEPTRGLDPIMVRELREAVQDLKRGGATIVINSHVLSEIETVCTHAAVIKQGKLVRKDRLDDLRAVDTETYRVVFSAPATIPEYVAGLHAEGDLVAGEIPAAMFWEFTRHLERSGVALHESSLKRSSLEDAFMNLVGQVS